MPDTPDWTDAAVFSSSPIVFNIAGLGNALTPGASVSVSIAEFASLVVVANSAGLLAVSFDFHQGITVGGLNDTVSYVEYLTCADVTQTPTWVLPVTAGSVQITNVGPSDVNIVVYGSNRPVPKAMILGGTLQTRSLSYSAAVTSGVVVTLAAIDGGPNSTSLNGTLFLRAASASIAGLIGYQYVTRLGVTRNVYVGSIPAGGNLFATATQPLGVVKWIVLPSGGTGTNSTFTLDIAPE